LYRLLLVFIDINHAELESPGVFLGQFLVYGADHPAWAPPRGPEVHLGGKRGTQHFVFKSPIGDLHDVAHRSSTPVEGVRRPTNSLPCVLKAWVLCGGLRGAYRPHVGHELPLEPPEPATMLFSSYSFTQHARHTLIQPRSLC